MHSSNLFQEVVRVAAEMATVPSCRSNTDTLDALLGLARHCWHGWGQTAVVERTFQGQRRRENNDSCHGSLGCLGMGKFGYIKIIMLGL